MTELQLQQLIQDELPREIQLTSIGVSTDENTIFLDSGYMIDPIFYLIPSSSRSASRGCQSSYMEEDTTVVTGFTVEIKGAKLFDDAGEEILLSESSNEFLKKSLSVVCFTSDEVES